MTAKEKAKELIDKYDNTLTYIESKSKAKQCALIAVDEILLLCWSGNEIAKKYWQEVRQEIEKL